MQNINADFDMEGAVSQDSTDSLVLTTSHQTQALAQDFRQKYQSLNHWQSSIATPPALLVETVLQEEEQQASTGPPLPPPPPSSPPTVYDLNAYVTEWQQKYCKQEMDLSLPKQEAPAANEPGISLPKQNAPAAYVYEQQASSAPRGVLITAESCLANFLLQRQQRRVMESAASVPTQQQPAAMSNERIKALCSHIENEDERVEAMLQWRIKRCQERQGIINPTIQALDDHLSQLMRPMVLRSPESEGESSSVKSLGSLEDQCELEDIKQNEKVLEKIESNEVEDDSDDAWETEEEEEESAAESEDSDLGSLRSSEPEAASEAGAAAIVVPVGESDTTSEEGAAAIEVAVGEPEAAQIEEGAASLEAQALAPHAAAAAPPPRLHRDSLASSGSHSSENYTCSDSGFSVLNDDPAHEGALHAKISAYIAEHCQGAQHKSLAAKSPYPCELMLKGGFSFVVLGANGTTLPTKRYDQIDMRTPQTATRGLLSALFTEEQLSSHTLTGKPSPAFIGRERPPKLQLDRSITDDIIFCVQRLTGCRSRMVRNIITTKCADTNKKVKRQQERMQQFTTMVGTAMNLINQGGWLQTDGSEPQQQQQQQAAVVEHKPQVDDMDTDN